MTKFPTVRELAARPEVAHEVAGCACGQNCAFGAHLSEPLPTILPADSETTR